MIYDPETKVRVGKEQVLMLLVYVYYPGRYGRKIRQGHRLVIEERAGATGGSYHSAENVLFPGFFMELSLHHAVAGVVAENGGVRPLAQNQGERSQQNGLSGTGLACNYYQTVRESDIKGGYQSVVGYGQTGQHPLSSRFSMLSTIAAATSFLDPKGTS